MINIGNDIISLKSINKERTKDERFYSKILSQPEADLYQQARSEHLPFEDFVWLLWSLKESVYKCHKRNNTSLVFSPKKIVVSTVGIPEAGPVFPFTGRSQESVDPDKKNTYNSVVHFEDAIFYGRSIVYQDLIYTLVTNQQVFDTIYWGIAAIEGSDYETQHTGVRSFALDRLAGFYPGVDLNLIKN